MTPTNENLFEAAGRVIAGGVNSPVRAWKSVGVTPFLQAMQRAAGSTIPRAKNTSTTFFPGGR